MFDFAYPYAFLLLPLALCAYWLLPRYDKQAQQALKVPFYDSLTHEELSVRKGPGQFSLSHGLLWLCVIFTLAGPEQLGPPQFSEQQGRNLMLALDLSGSMQLNDLSIKGKRVTRLTVVKQTARAFIKKRQGDRLGLVLFGTKAYLQTPLTFDWQTTLHMLDDATVGLAGQTTSIGDAIGLSVKRLQQAGKQPSALILLTDGVSNSGVLSPLEAADLAKSQHIKIYTIGLGADKMVIPGMFGPRLYNPSEELDEKTLKKVSRLTGGQFFRAKSTEELNRVFKAIDTLEPHPEKSILARARKPLYPYPLALSLFLFFAIGFRQLFFTRPKRWFLRRQHA